MKAKDTDTEKVKGGLRKSLLSFVAPEKCEKKCFTLSMCL